jgi:hypothetical protein
MPREVVERPREKRGPSATVRQKENAVLVSKNEQPATMTADRALGPFDLTGEVAIVTGGNGGIGLGMARGLAQAGAAGGDRRARQRGTKMMVKAIGIHPIGADACSVLTIGGIGEKHPVAYDKIQTFTLVRREDRWFCAAFQNTAMSQRAETYYN